MSPSYNLHNSCKNLPAPTHNGFFKFKFRNAEGKQSANFWVLVKHHRSHAVAHQNIGTADTGRASTDDRDFFIGPRNVGHIRLPAHSKGGIGNVLFGVAEKYITDTALDRKSTRLNSSHVAISYAVF